MQQHVLGLGKSPTRSEQLDLVKRRQRLRLRIDSFAKKAMQILGEELLDHISLDTEDPNVSIVVIRELDSESESDCDSPPLPLPDTASPHIFETHPEVQPLPFPSAVPKQIWDQFGNLRSLLKKEAQLREGQCNDCLDDVRDALINLSFEFKKKVRPARGNRQRTRAWSGVRALNRKLRLSRRHYNLTQERLVQICGDEITIKFPVLLKSDCRYSEVIADPNARGQSNKRLSWFWSSVQGVGNTDYATECE